MKTLPFFGLRKNSSLTLLFYRFLPPIGRFFFSYFYSSSLEAKSVRTSKSGPPELRRTLFLVMDGLLKSMPQDDPVYQFMDKKRAVGKPYLVYMTAGANKFLRIYYGRVKEYLASLETAD